MLANAQISDVAQMLFDPIHILTYQMVVFPVIVGQNNIPFPTLSHIFLWTSQRVLFQVYKTHIELNRNILIY